MRQTEHVVMQGVAVVTYRGPRLRDGRIPAPGRRPVGWFGPYRTLEEARKARRAGIARAGWRGDGRKEWRSERIRLGKQASSWKQGRPRAFSPERELAALDAMTAGQVVKEMADAFGVCRQTLYSLRKDRLDYELALWRHLYGLPPRRPRKPKPTGD